MSENKSKLGCCELSKSVANTLCCQTCKYKYHLSCVNIKKSLKDLSEDFKRKFTCPCCLSKLPKSDNTNTPIRAPASQASNTYEYSPDESAVSNVNVKRGGHFSAETTGVLSITAENIRKVIKEELESVLENFKISIIKEFEIKTREVLDRCNQISESLKATKKQQEDIIEDLKSNKKNIISLEAENNSLKGTVAELNSRLTRMEQYSRANNLELQNVPEHKSENLFSVVKQIARITDCKIEDTEIQTCTRIAKLNNDSKRPRSIVIKFNTQRSRDSFLASALKFNKKAKSTTDKLNTSHLGLGGDKKPVFVVEHLSPAQKSLHAEARTKAKELGYRFVWVRGGRIYMRKTETSEYKVIKHSQDLLELVN